MNTWKVSCYFAVILSVTWCLGCEGDRVSHGGSVELSRINMMIDQGQTGEAIQKLEAFLENRPNHAKARMLMASAYVAKANLPVTRFFDLAESLANRESSQEKTDPLLIYLEFLEEKKDEDEGKVASNLSEFLSAAYSFGIFLDRYNKIPKLPAKRIADLEKALEYLDEIERPSQPHALFRASLNVVFFKYNWRSRYYLQLLDSCEVEMVNVRFTLWLLKSDLQKLFHDLSLGIPKKEALFQKTAEDIEKAHREIDSSLAGIPSRRIPLGEWLQDTAFESLVECDQ